MSDEEMNQQNIEEQEPKKKKKKKKQKNQVIFIFISTIFIFCSLPPPFCLMFIDRPFVTSYTLLQSWSYKEFM